MSDRWREAALRAVIADILAEEHIPPASEEALVVQCREVLALIDERSDPRSGTLIVGICGSQGSGKTTVSNVVGRVLRRGGEKIATLSLDDFYLAGSARADLAGHIHPLLRTRGVPGTHDVSRGLAVFDRLACAQDDEETFLPAFDKARDEPVAPDREARFAGGAGIILFEGWCVGAIPEPESALLEPVNALERDEDPAGIWRRYVNGQLAGRYRDWFARLDLLILVAAPGFDSVFAWRELQERKLKERVEASGRALSGLKIMDEGEVRRFIAHYERITRHILAEMPKRADLVIELDAVRRVKTIKRNRAG